jgi:hypothetical protein
MTPSRLVDAIREMSRGIELLPGESIKAEVGSYTIVQTADGHGYEDVKVHLRVLCYLINSMERRKTYGGMHLRLAKCKKGTAWLKLHWLTQRRAGLFILFGYLNHQEGHFVGYNAESDMLFDGATGIIHNLCQQSINAIFPGGLDCILQLLLIEKDLIYGYRLQVRFKDPDFRTIAKGKYDMLLSGDIDSDWMV